MNDLKKQARFLKYILGLRPDEFGLVPDRDGYVKIKDLLKAVHEEAGWRSFRQANINEMMLSLAPPPLEISENRIRAKNTCPNRCLPVCDRKRYARQWKKEFFPWGASM